ncbi:hypothetical protein KFE25_004299 [Diacronema lutheri]|uniref:Amino acid transporter transmembrane domain-containing protein n=1 Tax=Diacronema lutheri TaxID=2081491 RepID=A0A8J5XFR7_DIALT|nr:hypothetical protein KFE25_004299 [Diacronema lutheri]
MRLAAVSATVFNLMIGTGAFCLPASAVGVPVPLALCVICALGVASAGTFLVVAVYSVGTLVQYQVSLGELLAPATRELFAACGARAAWLLAGANRCAVLLSAPLLLVGLLRFRDLPALTPASVVGVLAKAFSAALLVLRALDGSYAHGGVFHDGSAAAFAAAAAAATTAPAGALGGGARSAAARSARRARASRSRPAWRTRAPPCRSSRQAHGVHRCPPAAPPARVADVRSDVGDRRATRASVDHAPPKRRRWVGITVCCAPSSSAPSVVRAALERAPADAQEPARTTPAVGGAATAASPPTAAAAAALACGARARAPSRPHAASRAPARRVLRTRRSPSGSAMAAALEAALGAAHRGHTVLEANEQLSFTRAHMRSTARHVRKSPAPMCASRPRQSAAFRAAA